MQSKKVTIQQLFISTGDINSPREEVDTIEVDVDGIIGDKFYAKDSSRSILIASLKSYTMARDSDLAIREGDLGENILLNGDIYHLTLGDKIKLGDILLEVTQNCSLCKGLSKVDSKLPKLLKDDRGIFFKALNCGKIHVGDSFTII